MPDQTIAGTTIVASLCLVPRCPNRNDKRTGHMTGDRLGERLCDPLVHGVRHESGVVLGMDPRTWTTISDLTATSPKRFLYPPDIAGVVFTPIAFAGVSLTPHDASRDMAG